MHFEACDYLKEIKKKCYYSDLGLAFAMYEVWPHHTPNAYCAHVGQFNNGGAAYLQVICGDLHMQRVFSLYVKALGLSDAEKSMLLQKMGTSDFNLEFDARSQNKYSSNKKLLLELKKRLEVIVSEVPSIDPGLAPGLNRKVRSIEKYLQHTAKP